MMTNTLKYIDMSTYYKECFVEKIYHYEALVNEILKDLVQGSEVYLSLDKTDSKLRDNIKIDFDINGKKGVLGVISKDESKSMLPFFEAGRDDIFSAKICSNNEKETEDRQIKIVVYIVPKGEGK